MIITLMAESDQSLISPMVTGVRGGCSRFEVMKNDLIESSTSARTERTESKVGRLLSIDSFSAAGSRIPEANPSKRVNWAGARVTTVRLGREARDGGGGITSVGEGAGGSRTGDREDDLSERERDRERSREGERDRDEEDIGNKVLEP